MIEVLLPCPFCSHAATTIEYSFDNLGEPLTGCNNPDCFLSQYANNRVLIPVNLWNKRDQTAFLQFRSSLDREHTERMKGQRLLIIFESTIDFLLEFIKRAGLDLPRDVLRQWQEYKDTKSL